MKILDNCNPDFGKAFKRISLAMRTHFPNVEWVTKDPDIEIIEVAGKKEYDYLMSRGNLKNVVIFQQCLFTTGISMEDWSKLWKECKLVLSFHDLDTYHLPDKINFMRTPLGAEPDLFPISKVQRYYTVFSTGHVAGTECLDKVFEACVLSGKQMLHTGENFKWDYRHYQFFEYMGDAAYCNILQRVKYVTGLRITEGYEMACIEGAMTGAVPIILDLPTYSYYKDFGIFVHPDIRIVGELCDLFTDDYKPLSLEQINYVRNKFSWAKICGEIYKRL